MKSRRVRIAALVVVAVAIAACGLDVMGTATIAGVSPDGGTLAPPETVTETETSSTVDGTAPEPEPLCPASVNFREDGKNCGDCGHSCLGAKCAAGLCVPEVLLTGLDRPHGLALGPNNAYVAENKGGVIYRTSIVVPDGGASLVYDTGQAPRALALRADAGRLYWVEQTKVKSVTTAGAQAIQDDIAGGSAIVIDGDEIFHNDLGGENIVVRDPDLKNDVKLGLSQKSTVGIAVDDQFVYWTSTTGTITRHPRKGGSESVFIAGETQPESIALGPERLFWTTPTAIRATVKDGGSAVATVYDSQAQPRSLVRDGNRLYWLESKTGTLRRGTTNGGKLLLLATDEPQLDFPLTTAVAVDDKYVYWLSSERGTLKRVAK